MRGHPDHSLSPTGATRGTPKTELDQSSDERDRTVIALGRRNAYFVLGGGLWLVMAVSLLSVTQAELAAKIGVWRQTIIAIEQGRFCPSLESALRIAHAFDRPFEEIFQLDRARSPD